jgi:hypothetical protein
MFKAAFVSAFVGYPRWQHWNKAWLLRLAFSQWSHALQVRLVLRGSTVKTGTPASLAL